MHGVMSGVHGKWSEGYGGHSPALLVWACIYWAERYVYIESKVVKSKEETYKCGFVLIKTTSRTINADLMTTAPFPALSKTFLLMRVTLHPAAPIFQSCHTDCLQSTTYLPRRQSLCIDIANIKTYIHRI